MNMLALNFFPPTEGILPAVDQALIISAWLSAYFVYAPSPSRTFVYKGFSPLSDPPYLGLDLPSHPRHPAGLIRSQSPAPCFLFTSYVVRGIKSCFLLFANGLLHFLALWSGAVERGYIPWYTFVSPYFQKSEKPMVVGVGCWTFRPYGYRLYMMSR